LVGPNYCFKLTLCGKLKNILEKLKI